jgi:hypothetical protein
LKRQIAARVESSGVRQKVLRIVLYMYMYIVNGGKYLLLLVVGF